MLQDRTGDDLKELRHSICKLLFSDVVRRGHLDGLFSKSGVLFLDNIHGWPNCLQFFFHTHEGHDTPQQIKSDSTRVDNIR